MYTHDNAAVRKSRSQTKRAELILPKATTPRYAFYL